MGFQVEAGPTFECSARDTCLSSKSWALITCKVEWMLHDVPLPWPKNCGHHHQDFIAFESPKGAIIQGKTHKRPSVHQLRLTCYICFILWCPDSLPWSAMICHDLPLAMLISSKRSLCQTSPFVPSTASLEQCSLQLCSQAESESRRSRFSQP